MRNCTRRCIPLKRSLSSIDCTCPEPIVNYRCVSNVRQSFYALRREAGKKTERCRNIGNMQLLTIIKRRWTRLFFCRMSKALLAPSTFAVLTLCSDLSHKYLKIKIKSYVINKINLFDYNRKKSNIVINYGYSFGFSLIASFSNHSDHKIHRSIF